MARLSTSPLARHTIVITIRKVRKLKRSVNQRRGVAAGFSAGAAGMDTMWAF
jgi:hypothetical protein